MEITQNCRVGPWRIVPQQNLITDGEVERRIDHKHMQVLLYLIQRPGETVTKEALLGHVWEGKAVSEDVLSVAVSQIRKALGDKARQPTYIKTITGVGYGLIAPVESDPPTKKHLPSKPYAFKILSAVLGGMTACLLILFFKVLPTEPISGVAVLPISNLTGSEDRRFLADGVTETLIGELARLSDVKVISRPSVMGYGGTGKTRTEIGRELGVSALVEGAVQQSGDALVISIKLIDAQTNRHLWAQRFKGRLEDVLLLQERAARALVKEVAPSGAAGDMRKEDPPAKAYEAYLEARWRMRSGDPEDLRRARALFDGVIEEVPDFAPPYLGLAQARWLLMVGSGSPEVGGPDIFSELKALAERALTLDPNLGEAHVFMGDLLFLREWRFEDAEEHYLQALGLSPNLGEAHYRYSQLLLALGRFDEALAHVKTWRELNPLAYSAPTTAWIFNMSRRYHEAVTELARLEQLGITRGDPLFHISHLRILENMGRETAAFDHYLKLFKARGFSAEVIRSASSAFEEDGLKGLNGWLLDERREMGNAGQYEAPLSVARYCAAAGRIDDAFIWLEKAYDKRQMEMLWMNVDPKYDPLRHDPRFKALINRMGLPL